MDNPYTLDQLVALGYVALEVIQQGKIGKVTKKGRKFFGVIPNKTTKWDIKTNAQATVSYNFNGKKITAY
ncbi:hypothetical protein ACFSTH_07015 [Paenibacillus yanchengensis]|uniref:Uncharacterized protein n=1 Tax=Paenibacillus yanchengensis TaxID=2035833 RepID=A0ABW4YIC6_9BACL